MNIFDLLESPGTGRPRDTVGIQSASDQSAASVIGSGTTKREAKKKPVTMMGVAVKESVEEAAVKPNFKMPPESLQDKMYRQHQELRKQRGAPSAEEYKQRIAQKQAEIDALKESSYASDKNYQEAPAYKNYKIYVGKKPFVKQSTGEKYYIAVTTIGKEEIKQKGTTAEEAVAAIQEKIDFVLNAQQKVSANATLDFNVKFATDILSSPREPFFAKVENRDGEPKLIIASKDWLDFGKDLVQIGFKPSALRIDPENETSTPLPSISYTKNQIANTGLIANGRYEIGHMSTDKDGFNVFDLTYHSTAHTKTDKMRLNKPAVTVGTNRISEVSEGILDRAMPKMPKPRNPADQVLRGKVNAAGKHLDKKRRQELAPKHKHQDPLEEGAISNAIASAALASSMALGGAAHAGEPVVGMGQSQNMQMAVDMAKHNAKIKYLKSVHGDNFQDKQMPEYRFGKLDLKSNDKGGYIATVPLIVDGEVQNESLRPGERHHFEINPATGKREYKGIRGDRTDAPQRAKDDPAAKADQERRAHIQHDRNMTESKVVKVTDYDLWLDEVKELGAEIHPQKDRNVLVAQSWDGEEIGKFHLGKGYGFINRSGALDETIRKMGSQYRLLSKKGKNLGTFDTKAGAEKHEREVQYFKHKNMEEDQLDEACWKGYHKEGMKTMFGKRYPNCVKNKNESLETYVNLEECPGCGGHMVAEGQLTEKQDACYHKVKSRYKVWPSAYASGALVQCRKKGAANWGNKSNESITQEEYDQLDENLKQWFSDKWVRFGPDGKIRGDCARGDDSEGKPKCLPQSKAHALGKKGRASAAARKRKQDPNPERSGKAINVNTKKRSNEDVAEGSDYDHEQHVAAMLNRRSRGPQVATHRTLFDLSDEHNSLPAGSTLRQVQGSKKLYVHLVDGVPKTIHRIDKKYVEPLNITDEGWKGKLAGAALAGAAALGGGDVDAQNIDLPGPQVSYVAHVSAEANGREVHRTVNLGSQYSSEDEAYDDIERSLQAKGITRYNIRIEQKYDAQYYPGSNQPRGGTATGREYATPGIGDMVIKHIGREIRAGIPSKGGYATGGTNRGQRERDGSQWWRDQLPQIMREEALEEDVERHLMQMRRAGYDIVQEEWSDKYKRSINCSNPKGFSQKAHCAGRKKNKSK